MDKYKIITIKYENDKELEKKINKKSNEGFEFISVISRYCYERTMQDDMCVIKFLIKKI